MSQTAEAVWVEDLTVAYQDKPVLWDFDLRIPEGVRAAIIGPNGAGKSTLLKAMLGLLKPLSGYVKLLGQKRQDVYRELAYMPQSSQVNWSFPISALEVVLMGRYVHLGWIKRPRQHDYELAEQALAAMGMSDYRDRQINELSGGQKQRIFLARALCQDARLTFMDEPLAGVDVQTEHKIMDMVREMQNQGKTIVAVHHDLDSVPRYFDYAVMLNRSLIAAGPLSEVWQEENLRRTFEKV